MEWTKDQKDAIESTNGTVLVSAAAGSGKTAVLVERVIRRLIDKNNRIDADELLIVTFTNAAAEEMKERILSKLSDLLDENPTDRHIKRQQILINNAHISTVHSFCSDLIKEYFYKVNVSPDFRIAETSELNIIKEEAINNVLEDLYSQHDDLFNEVVEFFSPSRNDEEFVKTLFMIYEFLLSIPFKEEWIKNKLDMYSSFKDIKESKWGDIIFSYAEEVVENCIKMNERFIKSICKNYEIKCAYYESFTSDKHMLSNLLQFIKNKEWDNVHNLLISFKFLPLKALRGYDDNLIKDQICDGRKIIKDEIERLKKIFIQDEYSNAKDISYLSKMIEKLLEVTLLFDKEFNRLKDDKNILDFSDLERYALDILIDKKENKYVKSEEAREISSKFKEIMVDEYQDSNKIQDSIFRALSNGEKNLFMVGDVKQSIYGFRNSEPGLFLARKNSYELYDKMNDNYPSKIILDGNFRSKENIIDAVNFIFSQIMSKEVGDIDYTDEEKLVCLSKSQSDESDVEFSLIEMQDNDMDEVEAKYVCSKIKKMIENKYLIKSGDEYRPVTYGDFCILLRNFNEHADIFEKYLKSHSIPVVSKTSKSFLDSFEVNIILSFLKVIDNPIDDISIISILMSPIYGFSPDKLSIIKDMDNENLYFSIRDMASSDEDCNKFINDLKKYKDLSERMSVYRLILEILNNTGYESIIQVMGDKEIRINNLRLFIDSAKNYESVGNNGLSSFLTFINKVKNYKTSQLSSGSSISGTNAVKIISIHKSKGLEFPICILGGCSRKFNKQLNDMIINDNLGIGLKLNDIERMIKYDTITRLACLIEEEKRLFSEELRVLYVALTRAKDKLIMVTSIKRSGSNLLNRLKSDLIDNNKISPYTVKKAQSFSDWIVMCLLRHENSEDLREFFNFDDSFVIPSKGRIKINIVKCDDITEELLEDDEKNVNYDKEEIENVVAEIEKRINFDYHMKDLSGIPSKLTAGELAKKNNQEACVLERPRFKRNEGRLSPTERGTAFHLFLQYADYRNAIVDINREIDRLINEGFITVEQGALLNINSLNKFLHSDLVGRMIKSKNCNREYKFSIDMNLSQLGYEFDEQMSQETVVIQGAIDMFFEENDGFVIVDYKTDRINDLEELVDKYQEQLSIYKYALEKIKNKSVKESIIYSLYNNAEILI